MLVSNMLVSIIFTREEADSGKFDATSRSPYDDEVDTVNALVPRAAVDRRTGP